MLNDIIGNMVDMKLMENYCNTLKNNEYPDAYSLQITQLVKKHKKLFFAPYPSVNDIVAKNDTELSRRLADIDATADYNCKVINVQHFIFKAIWTVFMLGILGLILFQHFSK